MLHVSLAMSSTRSILLCLLLMWILLKDQNSYCATDDVCTPFDGENGTPSGIHRTCSVFQKTPNRCDSGSSYYHRWRSDKCQGIYSWCEPNCPGFVGMNLTYECSFEGARLYRYKNGEYQYLNGSSVNYGLLLPEHAGLYECRNSANAEVHAQNITVNGNH